jgi:signal transduction histidine kinase
MNGAGIPSPQDQPLAELSLVDSSDWEKTSETILQYCAREFGAESASIFFVENGAKRLHLVGAIGSRGNRHCGKSLGLGEGISGFVASTKDPLLVTDFSGEKRLTRRKSGYPVDTLMSCPVLKGSSVLAVINVAGRKAGPPFSKEDLKKFQDISTASAAILSKTIEPWLSSREDVAAPGKPTSAREQIDEPAKRPQAQEDYNEHILRALSELVFIFDHDFKITYCSREADFVRLFGGEDEAGISGRSILDLPLDMERSALKQRLDQMILKGEPFAMTNVQVSDSHQLCVLNMSFSPLSFVHDHPLGGLLLVDDNTKNYEMQQRLIEAEKFSLIGSLTSMITHEVNNPLDGVMRLINLSLAQLKEEQLVTEYLTEAQKGLNRIASLVSSLLNFSRKSMSLDSEYATLNAVIENAVAIMRSRKHGKDMTVDLDLAGENPSVKTNDFYQIISNLLSNSFDAAKSGRGNVKITTEIKDDLLHLTVEDDGCGIPEHVRAQMFNTFYTTKEYGKGTGLGLAIVKKMVEKYGGTIEADSQEDAGTTMRLTFSLEKLIR